MLIFAREEVLPTRFKLRVRGGQSMAIRAEKLGWGSRIYYNNHRKASRAGQRQRQALDQCPLEREWGSRGPNPAELTERLRAATGTGRTPSFRDQGP